MEIFADKATGYLNILSSGGKGTQGQNGGNGRDGVSKFGSKVKGDPKYLTLVSHKWCFVSSSLRGSLFKIHPMIFESKIDCPNFLTISLV